MSISLATKGIILCPRKKSVLLEPVPVCEPNITSYKCGAKYMTGIEMIPEIKTERRVRYEKKYLE